MRWLPLFFIAIILITPALALDKLTGFVNDEAGVISPENEQVLNDELYNLKLNTSVEMAVATVQTLNGTPIEDYSLNLAHLTLGEKGKDNGVLILLAVNDREYRIEVGYGLEPVLNAALLGRIGRNIIEPRFKEGNYEQGLLDGERVISAILRNDTSAETQASGANGSLSSQISQSLIVPGIVILVFAIIMIFSALSAYKKAKKKAKNEGKEDDKDFLAALILANMFGRGGGGGGGFGGSGGFGGGGFGGFGGGSFGGGGFSGKF